jgi:hypothetical protein
MTTSSESTSRYSTSQRFSYYSPNILLSREHTL